MAVQKWQEMWYKNVGSYNQAVDPKTWIAPSLISTTNTTPNNTLESTIKSGNFTASQRAEYNRLTWSNTGARDLMNNNKTLNSKNTLLNSWNLEMSNWTTIKSPADEGGFWSGVDYSNWIGSTGTSGSNSITKTPLELAQEEIAQKNAEIDKKNKEYEALNNKWATSELTAWVIPGMSWKNDAADFFKWTSDFLQTSLQTELANLDKQKADLESSIKGWQLSAEDQKATLQPYEQFLDKVTKLKDLNEQSIARQQEDLKNRYNTTIDRQRKANELSLTNAQKIAAITWVWFTSWGIQGIWNIIEDGNQAITSLEKERESMLSNYKEADSKLDIEYLDTITTIQNESKKAIQDRYNSVVTQIQATETAKGKATKDTLTQIKDVAKEYFAALDSQWNKDYKIMEFNYNKFIDYKKDLREQEWVARETQKNQLDLITKWDLTSLSDSDITTLITDMWLDKTTAQGLILTREKQKKDYSLEQQKLTQITPYQKAQYDLDVKKFWLEQAKFNLENWDYGGTVWGGGDLTSQIDSQKWSDTNVWKWTNNPWNIMWDSQSQRDYATKLGAVWFYNSKNGRTYAVFPTKETWESALASDLQTKLNWWSTWATKNTSLQDFATWWTWWPNSGKTNVNATDNMIKYLKQNWVSVSNMTNIGKIDPQLLANAVQYNEGTLGKTWPDWSNVWWTTTKTIKDFTDWDISLFNSAKYNPQTDKNKRRVAKYQDYINTVAETQWNPNSEALDLMKISRWWKDLSESGNKVYKDLWTVVSQLWSLKSSIDTYNDSKWFWDYLSPITWLIANKNPWDTKAQEIKAKLQALVPKVARWVFWEVWVLTDQDIANYIQTLPNIKQTADVQDVIQLALLWTVKASLENAVRTDSATYDISGLSGSYTRLNNKIDELNKKVTWWANSNWTWRIGTATKWRIK